VEPMGIQCRHARREAAAHGPDTHSAHAGARRSDPGGGGAVRLDLDELDSRQAAPRRPRRTAEAVGGELSGLQAPRQQLPPAPPAVIGNSGSVGGGRPHRRLLGGCDMSRLGGTLHLHARRLMSGLSPARDRTPAGDSCFYAIPLPAVNVTRLFAAVGARHNRPISRQNRASNRENTTKPSQFTTESAARPRNPDKTGRLPDEWLGVGVERETALFEERDQLGGVPEMQQRRAGVPQSVAVRRQVSRQHRQRQRGEIGFGCLQAF
jgi:hypothetical protein